MSRIASGIAAALAAAFAVALVLATPPARAGQNCEARQPEAITVQRSLELAERSARALEASGAQVVVLARAGQDLGRYGLRWSHLGFAYREQDGARTVWRVAHKLNQCGSSNSALYRQGLAEFFLDDLFEFAGAYSVLQPALQQQLLPILRDNQRVAQLHVPAYNMVAYPWALTYQQSNQWAIETLAWAADPAADSRERAQAWLRLKGYQGSVLRINAMTRLGARVGSAHIAFDDHPSAQRYADRIETVTVDSVFAWLERSGIGGRAQILR